MTQSSQKDIAESVRQRLLNQSRETGQDFQRVLVRYGIERLLYRLSQSVHRDRFVLKGAMLFAIWADAPFRATGDLDLLGYGANDTETAKAAFASLCAPLTSAKENNGGGHRDDGLVFAEDSITIEPTREDEGYSGLHVRLEARLKNIRIPILIDIGFGDVIHPTPLEVAYPTMLADLPAAYIRAYPPETVVAEKFDAMVRFDGASSRLKDHYDIWAISQTFAFDASVLGAAVRGTFAMRDRLPPADWPGCLQPEFAVNRHAILTPLWSAPLWPDR